MRLSKLFSIALFFACAFSIKVGIINDIHVNPYYDPASSANKCESKTSSTMNDDMFL